MTGGFLKTSVLWGFLLWLFGYVLGMLLFPFVPAAWLGWMITPFGIVATTWVLWKKIHFKSLSEFLMLGLIWAVIAVVCDYFFLVKLLNPADGYYKLDVYLYYALTVALPILVGWSKKNWIEN